MIIEFVCTGNTCRSAICSAYFRSKTVDTNVIIRSSGTSATKGSMASEYAIDVCKEHGIDLSGHRSSILCPERVVEASLIIPMTKKHRVVVGSMGDDDEKTKLLNEFSDVLNDDEDVLDPYGRPLDDYMRCFEAMKEPLDRFLDVVRRDVE